MKHLLTGVAVIAALAFCAPVGAQPTSPSGGNAMGMPGPNPGGPGLTPYTTGPGRPAAAPAPMAAPPAATMPPPAMSDTTSATPPKHRHARASSKKAHHAGRFPNPQGNNVANELNQAELARLQSGNFTAPPAPPAPDMGSPPTSAGGPPGSAAGRMPPGGRTTSDRYGR
jgi:hypothetical protein